jgi:hypothetical protein
VIELFEIRAKGLSDIREIHDPATFLFHFSADMNLHTVRMPVKTPALVALRNIEETVGSLELKSLDDIHYHQTPRLS